MSTDDSTTDTGGLTPEAGSAASPADVAPAVSAGQTSAEPAPAEPGSLRILVAEDEALIRMDLAEMLGEAGHEIVAQVGDGQTAVDTARETRPDLVVMDIKMPTLDGISAAEQIGRDRIAPVVLLTAFSDRALVERARDAGVMAYVVKPFSAADVLPALDIARSRWTEVRALESEVADLGERFETRKRLDRAKGLLQSQLKLTEADAFRWIQKTAMDRRLSMREVADAVIGGMDTGS